MIDIAWGEFIFVALLALILLGPKELPVVLRTLGRWVGKLRSFTSEIQGQLEAYEEEKISSPGSAPSNQSENDLKRDS